MTDADSKPWPLGISFNAHHAAPGAYFTFTCGQFGMPGGMGIELGRPADQDIFIGVKQGDRLAKTPLRCLPFYDQKQVDSDEEKRFAMDQAAGVMVSEQRRGVTVTAYEMPEIQRDYGAGTDRWRTPEFTFSIHTPWGSKSHLIDGGSGNRRIALLPAVIAEMTIDNSRGNEVMTGVFALRFKQPGVRQLRNELADGRCGFALGRVLGFAGEIHSAGSAEKRALPQPILRWTPHEAVADPGNPVHGLGNCPGIAFEVAPGEIHTLRLAFGCHHEGIVTTGIEGRYGYARYFANLPDVLDAALDSFDSLRHDAEALDRELAAAPLSADQRFLIAHAARSYYGSTQLLDVGGMPYWAVNEGEYRMLNTLDLAVDQVFFELRQHPDVVRNLLEQFVRFYSYHDEVIDPITGSRFPGGISFTHDQGINNQFSQLGHSAYELSGLPGCFSHMTCEQLCNWTLIAAGYVAQERGSAFLADHRHVINACLDSMLRRDHPDPAKRTGVMSFDSSRCGGPPGQEITTYDSLDESLAQARNNAYMAVKGWATYLGLALMFDQLGDDRRRHEAIAAAERAASTIVAQVTADGTLPAVFDPKNPGHASRILPACEGLVYPMVWSRMEHGKYAKAWLTRSGPFANLLHVLERHTRALLASTAVGAGANRFADGGIKLSSTSNNSWLSKIAIFQHVARSLFRMDERGNALPEGESCDARGFEEADAAHVRWLTTGEGAYWAMSDQILNGQPLGSKYYPRGVTNILWLDEVSHHVRG